MSELSTTAAYVLKRRDVALSSGASLDNELTRLLKTPHTVKSLAKALSQGNTQSSASGEDAVRARMQALLDDGIIELSPDS